MPLTVGDLREFLSDSASSMADAQAGRILNRCLQAILRRLSREGAWLDKRQRVQLRLEPRKYSVNALLVNGSAVVDLESTTADAFPLEKRFFEEKWNVQLADRETVYQFAGDPSDYTFRLAIPYSGASTPIAVPPDPQGYDSLSLTRSRYRLPVRFTQIYSIELPEEGINELGYLPRGQFEVYRRSLLTSSSQPWVYTVHNSDEIEFWPPSSEDRGFDCEIDLQEALRIPERNALDEEVLDWPEHMESLLWSAARLELVMHLGADAVQFEAGAVDQAYSKELAIYKTEDGSRGRKVWSMGGGGHDGTRRPFGLNLRGGLTQ